MQSIYCYIKVVTHKTSSIVHSKVKDKLHLPFQPSRNVLHTDSKMMHEKFTHLTRFSRKLDSALTPKRRSFRETAHRLIGTSIPSKPLSCFIIKSSVSSVAYVGGSIAIYLGLEHELAKSTSREVPVVYLNSLYVRLESFTEARGLNCSDPCNHEERYYTKHIIAQRSCMWQPMFSRMSLAHDFLDLVPRLPTTLDPTTRTLRYFVTYDLKVRITVSCAGKVYILDLANLPFEVLPPRQVGPVVESGISPLPAEAPSEPADTDQPPRYEDLFGDVVPR